MGTCAGGAGDARPGAARARSSADPQGNAKSASWSPSAWATRRSPPNWSSPRTAEDHVGTSSPKLGFTSRAQIATWAAARERPV